MNFQQEGQQVHVPRPWTARRRVSRYTVYPGHRLLGGGGLALSKYEYPGHGVPREWSAGSCTQAMDCQEEGQQVRAPRPWTAKRRVSRNVPLGHGLPRGGQLVRESRLWTTKRRSAGTCIQAKDCQEEVSWYVYPGYGLHGGGSAGRSTQAMDC